MDKCEADFSVEEKKTQEDQSLQQQEQPQQQIQDDQVEQDQHQIKEDQSKDSQQQSQDSQQQSQEPQQEQGHDRVQQQKSYYQAPWGVHQVKAEDLICALPDRAKRCCMTWASRIATLEEEGKKPGWANSPLQCKVCKYFFTDTGRWTVEYIDMHGDKTTFEGLVRRIGNWRRIDISEYEIEQTLILIRQLGQKLKYSPEQVQEQIVQSSGHELQDRIRDEGAPAVFPPRDALYDEAHRSARSVGAAILRERSYLPSTNRLKEPARPASSAPRPKVQASPPQQHQESQQQHEIQKKKESQTEVEKKKEVEEKKVERKKEVEKKKELEKQREAKKRKEAERDKELEDLREANRKLQQEMASLRREVKGKSKKDRKKKMKKIIETITSAMESDDSPSSSSPPRSSASSS